MFKIKESDFDGFRKRILLASSGKYRFWADVDIGRNHIDYIITNSSWEEEYGNYLSYCWLDIAIEAWNQFADKEKKDEIKRVVT